MKKKIFNVLFKISCDKDNDADAHYLNFEIVRLCQKINKR